MTSKNTPLLLPDSQRADCEVTVLHTRDEPGAERRNLTAPNLRQKQGFQNHLRLVQHRCPFLELYGLRRCAEPKGGHQVRQGRSLLEREQGLNDHAFF